MELSSQQVDALCELVNIGFGRAASALSILVGNRVMIEAPSVDLYPLEKLDEVLKNMTDSEITSIHQVFTGRIAGTAILLMNNDSSSGLVDLLSGGKGTPRPMTSEDQEAMRETGNILLNAFTGSFGNLLQVHISFTVPRVQYQSLRDMIDSLMIDQHELEYALLVRVNFQLSGGKVSGYVVIIMGIHSLRAMLEAMRAAGYID